MSGASGEVDRAVMVVKGAGREVRTHAATNVRCYNCSPVEFGMKSRRNCVSAM